MELRKKVPIKKQIVIKRIRTKSDTKIKWNKTLRDTFEKIIQSREWIKTKKSQSKEWGPNLTN
jgi:hypothetical protein